MYNNSVTYYYVFFWTPVCYFHWTMASFGWALLLCLPQFLILRATSSTHHAVGGNLTHLPFLCHPDQAKALLQLKKSFSFQESTTRLSSWRDGTDCCLWEGVGCDTASGNVTVLDLNNRGLSSYGLDPAGFSLTSLRRLDLSMNDFSGAQDEDILSDCYIPATGFERLALLTHLNLSNLGLCGQIPIGIGKLVNLVSLDLSNSFEYDEDYDTSDSSYSVGTSNSLWHPNFDTLVANLSNLRELYLDAVDLSSSGEGWCTSLATHVPRLQVLSLDTCSLIGPIHKSLSWLRSLVVINIQGNGGITAGPFPEFFMDFLNLTVLQLSSINLEGRFPIKPFQSKNLRVVDLSNNQDLSGHLPNFSYPNSLETLRLDWTNFSYARPMPSSNFKSLKHLSLGGNLSVDFLSSFGRLGSLCQLDLTLDSVNELGSIISWIGQQHKNLMGLNLALYRCNFSEITPTLVSNFKMLRSLKMVDCNLPRAVFCAIGNLVDLQTLEINYCTTYGSMPSSISNLTNLRNMGIIDSGFSGPVPTTIGKLTNLKNMWLMDCGFSGPMPAAIGRLTNLRNMFIDYCGFSGPIPAAIGNLTNLKYMQILGYNSLSPIPCPICHQNFGSSIPYAIGQISELEWLVLQDCNFYGSIPSSIANLTRLTLLDLSLNSLHGEIPPSIFSLPALRDMDLSFNQLSGPIHGFDKAVSQLEKVRLSNNALSGFIPEAFFQLTSLVHIDVSSNKLIGSVDLSHFWRLSELTSLYLSYNELHVTDADGNNPLATYLGRLHYLGLAACNITRFPTSLVRLNNISYLDLSSNKISGDIPNRIWETWSSSSSLSSLNLSHNMLTGMQLASDVLPFTNSQLVLDLSFNRFSGRIPMPNSSASFLEYSNNRFSSVPPNWAFYLRHTTYLSMSKNNINGHVPLSICNSMLVILDLSYNNFSGRIPPCLIENVPPVVLNFRENRFEGTLPSSITTGCDLQTIDLHGNKIEGKLPRGLCNCLSLEVLDFGGNRIADTFPSWLRGLPKLSVMVLRSNQLYGTIGDIVGETKSEECFPSLQIIDLASNNFSGKLKPQWFKLLKSMMAEFNSSGKIITAQNISRFNSIVLMC